MHEPFIEPSPAAGRRAEGRGGLCADPPLPERQAPRARSPPQGEGQCRPVPRKKSAVGGCSKQTRQLRNPAHPLSPATWVSPLLPHPPCLPRAPKEWLTGKKVSFCTRARGRSASAGGWEAFESRVCKRALVPQAGRSPEDQSGRDGPRNTLTFRPIQPLFLWPCVAFLPVHCHVLILFLPGSSWAQGRPP